MDVYFLLSNEFFKTKTINKTLKPILLNFTFEIVLACSSSSLRTISSTNTFYKLDFGKSMKMKNVFFVLGLKKNLLSISVLDAKGIRVAFVDGFLCGQRERL